MSEMGYQSDKAGITGKIEMYQKDVEQLMRYLPWLESKNGQDLSAVHYAEEGNKDSFPVPVYDSTLLGFVKTFQGTKFVDYNYMYPLNKHRVRTAADELKLIEETQIMEIENLGAVLSKYIITGMRKASMWNEGIRNGVYLAAVSKMKELVEFWSKPL